MSKIATLIFFLFCLPVFSLTQTNISQEIKLLLESPDDTSKVNEILDMARSFVPDSLVLSDELASEALAISEKIKFKLGIIRSKRIKGIIADYEGNLDQALLWYDEAIASCGQDPKWERERISLMINKGVAFYFAGDDGKALEQYIKAEAMCGGSYKDLLGKIYNNMAVIYRKLEKYEDAIRIYFKSLELKEELGDTLGMATTFTNIGVGHAYLGDDKKAIDYLEKAKAYYTLLGEQSEALSVDFSLAMSLYELEEKARARDILINVLASEQLNVKMFERVQGELLLAKIYLDEENYQKSQQVLEEVYPKIKGRIFSKPLQVYYLLSAHTKHGLGRINEAYDQLLEHKLLTDTIIEADREELLKEMETKYLTQEKEAQIEIQQLELAKNQKERQVFIFALAGLGIILFLVFFLFRQRQKANRLLSQKNEQIQKALGEKEILLKEIHHRVKNNLQIISSLLNLQSRQIDDPKALEAIQEGRNRVNSMALIHKNLYQEENLVGVNAAEYIDKLTDSLMASYQISENKVNIKKDIDPIQLDVDVVIPLGLILNELITNSLKYAFEEKEKGAIQMSLKKEEQGLRLKLSDNGKGLPDNFNFEQLSSLGFRLIKAFAQKLEASLNITSKKGTQVELFIPKLKLV